MGSPVHPCIRENIASSRALRSIESTDRVLFFLSFGHSVFPLRFAAFTPPDADCCPHRRSPVTRTCTGCCRHETV